MSEQVLCAQAAQVSLDGGLIGVRETSSSQAVLGIRYSDGRTRQCTVQLGDTVPELPRVTLVALRPMSRTQRGAALFDVADAVQDEHSEADR